jgi:hypothetical protein
MFEDMNEILAQDADYVVWRATVEAQEEDEAYTTWLMREEQRLNPDPESAFELVNWG